MVRNPSFVELIAHLRASGVLKSKNIEEALHAVDRKDFVSPELASDAYIDAPLPIGFGQTISQPYTVVFMLELLDVREGNFVFDVGTGSGWQTALLAYLVGEAGRVYTVEIVPELCAFGKENIAKYKTLVSRAVCFCKSADGGAPEAGGFDRIIAAAEVATVPRAWRKQLKAGGRLVYPKASSIFAEVKRADGGFDIKQYHGFAFVPFIEG